MPLGLSVREFAQRDGCSPTLVQRGKATGRIAALADGSLDPKCVGTEWRESVRRAHEKVVHNKARAQSAVQHVHVAPDDDAARRAAEAIAAVDALGGVFPSRGEAEKVRDSYIAHLRRIEYEQKSGQVVDVNRVVEQVEDAFNRVRTRLTAIPAEQAPALFRCKTVLELQDALAALIAEVLEELSRER